MKHLAILVVIGLLLGAVFPSQSEAANSTAKKIVAEMIERQTSLLQQYPSLSLIDNVVRADCSARSDQKAPSSEFCGCASAVTMNLWMSGMDPKMIDRLNAFLQQPSEDAAQEFAAYQGPELYAPLCEAAA
ncbi:hypothetical protein T8S45_07170 [Blastomonas marina]|uniref:hypothetical protein n=1 Tax=Blastomonas marina TaxID=1867408 RepID=UPI002AC98555|nr:hypothetical protein [Blastomonas marina]WPZ02636.1 hypothetical protein T8S45_07170 [Blastomonas marina]